MNSRNDFSCFFSYKGEVTGVCAVDLGKGDGPRVRLLGYRAYFDIKQICVFTHITSPTAHSPDYVPESDPEADPEEDDDEDPEEDPIDYPANGGDDGDDDEVVALPATEQALSAEEKESFETDKSAATPPPQHAYRVTARIFNQLHTYTSMVHQRGNAKLLGYISTSFIITTLSHGHHHFPDPSPPLPSNAPLTTTSIALGPAYEGRESSSADYCSRPAGGLSMADMDVTTRDREIRPLAALNATLNGVDSPNSGTGAEENQRDKATLWNSHVRTVGNGIAYAMTWTELKKKITDKYCPRTEIKKLEVELWELKVKGTDVIGYNQRFQELALLCGRMFPEESDKIEKYVGGLPDMIHGSVVASNPKTMQEATEIQLK
ncbi:reverse transcriptase domain-containing protein [Tanacetum coccineum]